MTSSPSAATRPEAVVSPALECDLGYMLGVVFRAYVRATEAVVAAIPGGPRGFQVLSAAAEGAATGQGALALRLGIDKTVMTYLVDDLENAGLVERQRDPADRRNKRVVATPRGVEATQLLRERLQGAEDDVLSPLGADEQDTFRGMLQRLASAESSGSPGLHDACTMVEELTSKA